MNLIETHRSFVNTWDCDENNHLNVQFYFQRFAEAAEIFCLKQGHSGVSAGNPEIRQVRFLRELRSNISYSVASGIVADGTYKGHLIHLLKNESENHIAASALDMATETFDAPALPESQLQPFLPRGVAFERAKALDVAPLLASNQAIQSCFFVARPSHCDPHGFLLSQNYVSCFTDGAPHIWDHIGLTTHWLEERGFGRIAMEMKLSILQPVKSGTAMRLISWAEFPGGKTFRIHHQIHDLVGDVVYAKGEVVGLIMDLSTRKSVPLPDFLTQP